MTHPIQQVLLTTTLALSWAGLAFSQEVITSQIQKSAEAKNAKGSFSCDFGLPGSLPLNLVPPLIERDRMYMAEQPGMRTKHLPLRFDQSTGNLMSGGRYLFDTYEEA